MSHLSLLVRWAVAPLAALLLAPLLAVSATVATPAPAGAATTVALTLEEQAHLDLLNQYRRERGLPALAVDARAQLDARRWARAMSDSGTLAHDPALGDACYRASSTCGGWAENVGVAGDHVGVFQAFAASASHARNMAIAAGDVPVRVGIAVLRSGSRSWVVQRFFRCHCDNEDLAVQLNRDRTHALAFARALHEDFLDSSGSASSLDFVAAPLAYGFDRRGLVGFLAWSDTWIGAMVDRFYESTLGRTPDAQGRAYWVDQIRSGRSPAEVAAQFYASTEYFQSVGGTRRAWVGALYEALLGRAGDASGIDHWVTLLAWGVPRRAVAMDFYQSVESRSVRVRALYALLLGRQPDERGLIHWIFRLADGQDVALAVDLAGSDEYLHRAIQRFA